MAKSDKITEREPETPWGTWEELLLACAVNRYGTKNWDSVAIEIQKRSPAPTLRHLLTPNNCKQKYQDLERRYTAKDNGHDTVPKHDDADDDNTETIPWLDELRKLRVAELKRELERYDLSIVSLKLKVKKLKEEREQSSRESEKGQEKSDPEKTLERERERERREGDGEPDKLWPGSVGGKPAPDEESDREDQSVNESNSTDPKVENLLVQDETEKKQEPAQTDDEKPDPAGVSTKPAREDSCNGSSDSIAKEPAGEPVKAEQEGGASESPELLESVAESKGGNEEGAKENSDVQSSASLSRQKGRNKVFTGACSSGEEPENEDQSPAIKGACVKSQSLVDFLEIVRSHKLGSIFERRLESQETQKYKNLIRQHIDLETIRTRIEEGWYLGCNRKFSRDLLLLVNNAIVFFGKKSSESAAAVELWQLISKEMAPRNPKSDLSAEEQTSLPATPLPAKPDPEAAETLPLKPKMSGSMIVCRKRSSIAAKASGFALGADKKREQPAASTEEKPVLDWKLSEKHSANANANAEEHQITKKRSSDRFTSGSRSTRKNSGTRANANKNSDSISSQNQGKEGSPAEHSEPRTDKKNTTSTTGAKKQSAANFLSRMKRSPSLNNGSLLDTLKNSAISSDNTKGVTEQKKNGNGKGEGRKYQITRSSGGRQVKEQGIPAKRSVGRPPKGAAAPPPAQPSISGKRNRGEGGETEAVASRQSKKRSRK